MASTIYYGLSREEDKRCSLREQITDFDSMWRVSNVTSDFGSGNTINLTHSSNSGFPAENDASIIILAVFRFVSLHL